MTIGWYVHHQGAGHAHRLACVAPYLDDVTVLSSRPGPGWISLPDDADGEPAEVDAGGTLHWAPLRHAGLRERMAAVSAWIAEARPDAMVVDVSVEVALLARLHGVPTVLVAQRGRRLDAPHRLAYAQAAAVVAPWTTATHVPGDLPRDDLHFAGALSRFDDHAFSAPRPGGDVLVLLGSGGHDVTPADIGAACRAVPDRTWHLAGGLRAEAPNLHVHGPDAPVADLLDRCSVVVATAGNNVVGEVAAARRPLICLPQPRPFGEQVAQAAALERLGVAVVAGGAPWPMLLDRAEALDTERWDALHDGHGAERLAAVVQRTAGVALWA